MGGIDRVGESRYGGFPKVPYFLMYLSGSGHSGWQDGSENLSTSVCLLLATMFLRSSALFQEEGYSESVRTWGAGRWLSV